MWRSSPRRSAGGPTVRIVSKWEGIQGPAYPPINTAPFATPSVSRNHVNDVGLAIDLAANIHGNGNRIFARDRLRRNQEFVNNALNIALEAEVLLFLVLAASQLPVFGKFHRDNRLHPVP